MRASCQEASARSGSRARARRTSSSARSQSHRDRPVGVGEGVRVPRRVVHEPGRRAQLVGEAPCHPGPDDQGIHPVGVQAHGLGQEGVGPVKDAIGTLGVVHADLGEFLLPKGHGLPQEPPRLHASGPRADVAATELGPEAPSKATGDRLGQAVLQREELPVILLDHPAAQVGTGGSVHELDGELQPIPRAGHASLDQAPRVQRLHDAVQGDGRVPEGLDAVPGDDLQALHLGELVDQPLGEPRREIA